MLIEPIIYKVCTGCRQQQCLQLHGINNKSHVSPFIFFFTFSVSLVSLYAVRVVTQYQPGRSYKENIVYREAREQHRFTGHPTTNTNGNFFEIDGTSHE